MQCNKCGNEAIFFQHYSGQHLCKRHFVADVEAKAKRSIRTHHWLRSGDQIAVAVSGDYPSSALLSFFKKLSADRRDIRIIAITIDEGADSCDDPAQIVEFSESLGIPCICGSFIEELGVTAADITGGKGRANTYRHHRALRSCVMTRIALRNGITRIALGFTLDKGAQGVLMNFLTGDVRCLLKKGCTNQGKIPWISPFIAIPLDEIRLYAELNGAGTDFPLCPDDRSAIQKEILSMLDRYDQHHPATKYALMNLGEQLCSPGVTPVTILPFCYQTDPCDCLCEECRLIREVTENAA